MTPAVLMFSSLRPFAEGQMLKNKNISAFLPQTDLHPEEKMYERRSTFDVEYEYEYGHLRSMAQLDPLVSSSLVPRSPRSIRV